MADTGSTNEELIESILAEYEVRSGAVRLFMQQLHQALQSSGELADHIHSIKSRLKDPDHLRDKLQRKMVACEESGDEFEVAPDNLLVTVNDLAGVRVLHLYTRQIREIDRILREIFAEQLYELVEGPFARTWDDESREYFQDCGIETQVSPTMYTSVHYVVSSASRTRMTCEVQVRTLMEEVWGEVDHLLNYPRPSEALALREQLKVLARATSTATRLVDSIFLTQADLAGGG
jgi:putative GTP pyrophosphokinase